MDIVQAVQSIGWCELRQHCTTALARDTSPFEAAELNTINLWEATP